MCLGSLDMSCFSHSLYVSLVDFLKCVKSGHTKTWNHCPQSRHLHHRSTAWSRLIATILLLECTVFLSMTPLKVGLPVRGVARVHDNSLAKSTNGLLLVFNRASIIHGKTKCFQIALFVLKLGFTFCSNLFTVDISVYTQAEGKLRLSTALSDNC